MKSWFGRRDPVVDPVATPVGDADELHAYREGRLDERDRADHRVVERPVDRRAEVNAAYDRGRLEGRARRRGSPLISFIVLVVFVIGALMLYLTLRNGSVTAAGQVADRNLSTVAQKVQAPIRGAEDRTGSALQNAGQDLKQNAGSAPPPATDQTPGTDQR